DQHRTFDLFDVLGDVGKIDRCAEARFGRDLTGRGKSSCMFDKPGSIEDALGQQGTPCWRTCLLVGSPHLVSDAEGEHRERGHVGKTNRM
ncbi:hypothetical protein EBU58_09295, partial [bacterium]|nr:hypothetical protein [bacterium]